MWFHLPPSGDTCSDRECLSRPRWALWLYFMIPRYLLLRRERIVLVCRNSNTLYIYMCFHFHRLPAFWRLMYIIQYIYIYPATRQSETVFNIYSFRLMYLCWIGIKSQVMCDVYLTVQIVKGCLSAREDTLWTLRVHLQWHWCSLWNSKTQDMEVSSPIPHMNNFVLRFSYISPFDDSLDICRAFFSYFYRVIIYISS